MDVTGRTGAFAATMTVASLWSFAALADQFVVLDSTWEHTADLPDSHFHVDPLPGTPADWTSPVDYSTGTAYIHLEVFTKPTDTPTKFQVCFEATPTYACTDQSPTYTTVGVLDWSTPFANFWSPPNTMVDWSQGTNKLAVILKDTQNGKPSADNVGAETAALYTPTQVHMVVTIVAEGSVYMPPSDRDAGTSDDAGADPDAGRPPVDAGKDASPGPDPNPADAGGTGGAPAAEPSSAESDGGCNTARTGGAGPCGWLAIALAVFVARRRRITS